MLRITHTDESGTPTRAEETASNGTAFIYLKDDGTLAARPSEVGLEGEQNAKWAWIVGRTATGVIRPDFNWEVDLTVVATTDQDGESLELRQVGGPEARGKKLFIPHDGGTITLDWSVVE